MPNNIQKVIEEGVEAFFTAKDEYGYSIDIAAGGGDLNSKDFVRELLSPKIKSTISNVLKAIEEAAYEKRRKIAVIEGKISEALINYYFNCGVVEVEELLKSARDSVK